MPNSVDALKSRFNALLSDNKVTSQETEELISLVKDGGGVTQSERRQLREQLILNESSFDSTAKDRLWGFINNEMPGLMIDTNVATGANGRRNLEDPDVLNEHKQLAKYAWTEGELFKNGASEDDVIQGAIGNCYMVSAFAAIAAANPKDIENSIKDNGDGTYTVSFKELWGFAPAEITKVTVDGQLPLKNGGLVYGKNRDRSELWVGLLEKAYAQWKGAAFMMDDESPRNTEIISGGHYDSIGNGGSAGDVMQAIIGRRSRELSVEHMEHAALFKEIKTAIDSKKAVVGGTHGENQSALYTGTGLYAHHGYSVHGTSEENGKKYIHLRNPWGEVEPAGNGPDDGSFKLEISVFAKLFGNVFIC